ncbi:hypothetical protein DFR26_1750 [Paraperlucidibaca baekdonensis]|uniref:Uncharacterized protein n=1 Tax=Paraperlucidibaca baekdonensis TaxID=748120 RepID=A0A3E0H559_9GAMM|nr:DUF6713 family protein [Paraperlucidibaca baekdonensis]REH37964.1 hypothetical protein DFR26_1750 [Paraperlucidibaca baekdonensis]
MSSRQWLEVIFLLNATVLCVHQIDAAFWHEWNMFKIPGGNQINLLLNLPIIASVFMAFRHVVKQSQRMYLAHIYLVALGLLTLLLHTALFVTGYNEFLQPMSLLLITAAGVLSVTQLFLLWADMKSCRNPSNQVNKS